MPHNDTGGNPRRKNEEACHRHRRRVFVHAAVNQGVCRRSNAQTTVFLLLIRKTVWNISPPRAESEHQQSGAVAEQLLCFSVMVKGILDPFFDPFLDLVVDIEHRTQVLDELVFFRDDHVVCVCEEKTVL